MTGDGVNDAPALKQADIGDRNGHHRHGSQQGCGATMILTDDNFATIVKAVATGRNIYANIRNAIVYLLSGNLSGIITVLVATLAAWPLPFLPVHLLFINLITDSLPALAIGMERSSGDVLKDKPRDPSAGILNASTIRTLGMQGILIAIVTIIAFVLGMGVNDATAQTMAFAVLCLSRLFHGFDHCRSEYSLKHIGLSEQPLLYRGILCRCGIAGHHPARAAAAHAVLRDSAQRSAAADDRRIGRDPDDHHPDHEDDP